MSSLDGATYVGTAVGILALVAPFVVWTVRRMRRSRVGARLDYESLRDEARVRAAEELNELIFDDKAVDLVFTGRGSSDRGPEGANGVGALHEVLAVHDGLSPKRVVVLGQAGVGKTVLALELLKQLLDTWRPGEPVPVRLDVSSWTPAVSLNTWLARAVHDQFVVAEVDVLRALANGRIVPVLDGVDELDTLETLQAAPSADSSQPKLIQLLAELNRPPLGRVIIACRTDAYASLAPHQKLQDACELTIHPLTTAQIAEYVDRRVRVRADWEPVLDALREQPDGPLAATLRTLWWLATATDVCSGFDGAPAPAKLVDLAHAGTLTSWLSGRYRDRLLSVFGDPRSADVRLSLLASYLTGNTDAVRSVDGVPLSGSALVIHELWPVGGTARVLRFDVALASVMALPGLALFVTFGLRLGSIVSLALLPLLSVFVAALVHRCRVAWNPPQRFEPRKLVAPAGLVQMAAPLAALPVGYYVGGWPVALSGAFAAWMALGLSIGLSQSMVVRSEPRAMTPDDTLRDEFVVSMLAGVGVSPLIAALLATELGWALALPIALAYGIAVGATVASAVWRRYLALLLATRGRLPWRLRPFLRDAHRHRVLRRNGSAYQFRHQELQHAFAASRQ